MDDRQLKVFLAEYAALSASFDKHATAGYAIAPVALTAIGVGAALGGSLSPYSGPVISMMLLVLIAWEGVSHAIHNAIGLRLIEIELRLREELRVDEAEKPFFFTSFIGSDPGLGVFLVFFAIAGSAILYLSMSQWYAVLVDWQYSTAARVAWVGAPVLLNVLAIVALLASQRQVVKRHNGLRPAPNKGIEQNARR